MRKPPLTFGGTHADATPRFAEVRSKTTARSAQVDHSAIRDRIRAGRMNKQGQRIGAGLHGSSPLSKAQKLEGTIHVNSVAQLPIKTAFRCDRMHGLSLGLAPSRNGRGECALR